MAERENSEEVEESTQGIIHATDNMIHWCSKFGSNFDHVSFFKKFSAGAMKEPVPDELLCLNRCWKCVQEYYQRRRKYLEGCELQTEGLLYTFECIVLMHFLKCLNNKRKAKKRSKDRAISSMSPPKDHAKIGLPIVVQQILQYPFFLFMKEIHDLFIEILVDLLKEKKDYLNVSKFPGLYLLLIHPNEEIHSWAKGAVKNFCPIELQDSSDLLRAINLVLSVLKFNLQTDPILCDNLGLEEPSCRIIIMSHLFSMKVYWHGLQTLLNHMDTELVSRVHREIPQTILNSLLQAAASEDPGGSAFLKKLSCFAVVLKSFKGEVWLQVHQTQELVFLSIIKCKVWLTVLDEMCSQISSPNSLSLVFNWITHWASSLSGSESCRFNHTQYCAVYAYHILSLVQHRLFHLQPNMEHFQSCKGPSKCNFCHFKHRKKNQLVIEVEVPFLRNQENLATLMRITRNLFREKFLLGRSSSKGISIPKRVLPSQAGFLTYDQIVCMVASEQQGHLNQMIDSREESPRSLNTTKEKPNSSVATGNIDSKDDKGLSKMLEKIHKEKVSSTPRKHGPNSQMKFPPKGNKRRKMYPLPPKRTSDVKAGGQNSHNRLRTTRHLDKKGRIAPRDAQRLELRKCVVSVKKLPYPRKNEVPQEGSNSIEEHEAVLPPKKKAHPSPCDSDSTDCEMDTAQTDVMGHKDDEDLPGDMEVDPHESNTGRNNAGNNSLASHDNDQQISDISSSQTDDRNDTIPNAILLNSGKHNKIMESDSDSEWDPPDVLNRDGENRELYNREGTFSKTEPSQINKGQSNTLQEATERKVEREEMEGKENSLEEKGKVPRVKPSEPMDDFFEKKEALIRKLMGEKERSNDDREVSRPKSNKTGHEDGRGKSTVEEAVKIKQEKFDDAEDNAHEILSSDDEDDDDILEIKVIHPFCYVVSTDDEDETEKKTAGQELEDKDKNQAMSTVSVERAATSLGIRPSSPGEKQAQMTEEASMTSGNAPSAEVQKLANTEGEISPSEPVNKTSHVEEHRQSRKEQRTITILNRKPQSPVHNNSVQSIGSEEYHSLAQTTKGKCDPSSCDACKDQKGKHRVRAPHEDSARRKRKMQHVVRKDDSDKDSVFMNNEVDSGADGDDEDVRVGLDKDEGKSSEEEENGDWEVENGDEEKSLPKDSEKAANASDTNDSLVDSDAETDDGSGLGEAHNMHSLDFLDEALMVNGWRREASKNVDDDVEDGESSDGLELSEIIDHTESLVWDVKEEKQEKGMEDEKNLIIKKDVKESNDGNVNRITEHRPSHHHAVSAPDINRVDVDSESVMRDVSKTGKVDKGAGDSSSPQKGDKLLMNILEGVGPDGDDDEDEEEGSDGWLEGDGEAEDENEEVFKDNSGWVPDDQENVSCSSQGLEVSNEIFEMDGMCTKVSTGNINEYKSAVEEAEEKKEAKTGKPSKKNGDKSEHGIQSKSFYKKQTKVGERVKNSYKRKPPPLKNNHARMQKMQRKFSAQREAARMAVPLGRQSLVTGQRRRSSFQQEDAEEQKTEDNQTKDIPETRLAAPTVKSSSYRSRRADSLIESFKEAEGHRGGKVRIAHQRTPRIRKSTNLPANMSLSSSFKTGVESRPREERQNGTPPGTEGDILSPLLKESAKTHKEVREASHRPALQSLTNPTGASRASSSVHPLVRGGDSCQKKRVQFDLSASVGPATGPSSAHHGGSILKSPKTKKQYQEHNPDRSGVNSKDPTSFAVTLSSTPQSRDSTEAETNPPFGSPRRKPAKMTTTKQLTVNQFLGWILSWNVSSLEERQKDTSKILKGCDFKTLKQVPNSFTSIDQFYDTFLPLKMVQIWTNVQHDYRSVSKELLPSGLLVESFVATVENKVCKTCKFSVPMATKPDRNPNIQYPKKFDLVMIRQDEKDRFCPVFGYVEEAVPYESIAFYSASSSSGLMVRARIVGDVQFKGHNVTFQVVKSLECYIQQFSAFCKLPNSVLASSILCPTRKDVFCMEPGIPLDISIYKEHYHNTEQRHFVRGAFHCIQESYGVPRICMLQGPPCSGKTRTLATLIACLLRHSSSQPAADKLKSKPKILLCAPSDCALDVLLQHVWNILPRDNLDPDHPNTPAGLTHFILRLGDVADIGRKYHKFSMEKIVKDTEAKHDNTLKQIRKRIGMLEMREQDLDASIQYNSIPKKYGTIEKLRKEKTALRSNREVEQKLENDFKAEFNPDKTREELIVKADVICCRVSDVSSPVLQKLLRRPANDPLKVTFSCAIIDEACQCLEVDTILPLYSTITKLVLAGDPKELKPKAFPQIPSRLKLSQSLFTRLWMNFQGSSSHPVQRLTDQCWCHPEIFSFPNKIFYHNRIRNNPIYGRENFKLTPYLIFNLKDSEEKATSDGDLINEAEIDLVQNLVDTIFRHSGHNISLAIIAPYREQVRRLKQKINNRAGPYIGDIKGLQGKMKDIVIISCVKTQPYSQYLGFLDNHNELNVALTRAAYSVFIIGNFEFLPKINRLWNDLFIDAKERDLYVNVFKEYIKKLSTYCVKEKFQEYKEVRIQRKEAAKTKPDI
ncbi:uncharacterized protein [Apostichopus japonicus]